jgi:hypothetical protein
MASGSSESKPAGNALTLSPYVFRKLRIDKSQTRLSVENYQLVCTPYRLSEKDAIVFAVLTPGEIQFFAQYEGADCALQLAFAARGGSVAPQLRMQGTLTRVGPVKGRENVALFAVRFQQPPQALGRIIENFTKLLDHLAARYKELAPKRVPMENLRIQRALGYRKYAELRVRSKTYPASPRILAVDRAEVRVNASHVDFKAKDEGMLRLDFNSGVAHVPITVTETSADEKQENTLVGVRIGFDPLYVEILDQFFAGVERKTQQSESDRAEEAASQAGDADSEADKTEADDDGEAASELTEEED